MIYLIQFLQNVYFIEYLKLIKVEFSDITNTFLKLVDF